MNTLPLFLLDTVLYPSTPVFLHIFEERYKEMMNWCIEQKHPFGLMYAPSLSQSDSVNRVGCVADIVEYERLDDGRLNMVAIGRERFQVEEVNTEASYLRGLITPRPLVSTVKLTPTVRRATYQLKQQIYEYVNLLKQLAQVQFDIEQLPNDTADLSYMAAFTVQFPIEKKQEFLLIDDLPTLLQTFLNLYPVEIALLRQLAEQRAHPHDFDEISLN